MTLLEAENYKRDWYGWLTNQSSHALWGAASYIALCGAWFYVCGEYPVRWVAWLIIAVGYLTFEFVVQRGRHFWDSVEDFVFWCCHGAGVMALTFKEVMPGSPEFVARITDIFPILGFFIFHCAAGVAIRIYQSQR